MARRRFRLEAQLKYSQRNEAESATCHECGKAALYRTYTPQGVNIGACASHKDGLKAKSGFAD